MDYNHAIKLFGLDNSFTLEELKRKYKELLKKYHPDNNSSKDASQKTNEVINAYNLLKNYVSTKKTSNRQKDNDNTTDVILQKEKEELKQKIEKKYLKKQVNLFNVTYVYYNNKQKEIVCDALYSILKATSHLELLKITKDLKFKVNIIILDMISELNKKSPVQNRNVKKRINNLQNFCDNVYDIFYEYNKIIEEFNKISSKLDLVIEKFRNYVFFDKLELKILTRKDEMLKSEYLLDFPEKIISNFEKEVNDIFKEYERKIKCDRIKIKEIIKKYQDSIAYFKTKDDKLKDKCTELLSLTGEDNFDIKYKEVNDELDELIKEMKKNKIKQNNIFNKLVKEYYSKVESLNLIGDLTQIKNETEKLNKIIKIFENLDELSIEALTILEMLKDAKSDDIDKYINMVLYGKEIGYDDIFLYKNASQTHEVVIVENIDENNVFYRAVDDFEINKLPTFNFKNEYISLKKFINESEFIGKEIFFENNKFGNINNPILLCRYIWWELIISNDYKEFMIIDTFVDYNIGSEQIIEEISKDEIYNIISHIVKNAEYKQDSDSNIKKNKENISKTCIFFDFKKYF